MRELNCSSRALTREIFISLILHGGRNFVDPDDPAHAAVYRDALEELIAKQLVRLEGGILYSLTGAGFKVARRLRDFMSGTEG